MRPSRHVILPAALLFLALTACDEEATPTPTPAEELTPTPGPNIDHQTWASRYVETDDPLVYADTWLYFGSEHQNGTELIGYLFHLDGPLIIDGYDVPDDQAIRMTGTYLWERQIDVSVEYYGHLLHVAFQVNPEATWMEGWLTIDGDAYQQYLGFVHCNYIKINDDE